MEDPHWYQNLSEREVESNHQIKPTPLSGEGLSTFGDAESLTVPKNWGTFPEKETLEKCRPPRR